MLYIDLYIFVLGTNSASRIRRRIRRRVPRESLILIVMFSLLECFVLC
jgi:hypothetical protein